MSSRESVINVWDTASGLDLATLRADVIAETLRFSADGHRLLAGRNDRLPVHVWDATPVPPEVEADQRVAALALELPLKDEIVERLEAVTGLDDAVRRAAISIAAGHSDNPDRLYSQSMFVIRASDLPADRYRQALRYAEAAAALRPDDGKFLNALGVARYRVGRYPEALEALTRSEQINRHESGPPEPVDLAFLAMTCEKLGRHEEAQQHLARLRDRLKDTSAPSPITGTAGPICLSQAEALIEPKSTPNREP
jgi:tetratricopeptide (TPR) repeat protein